MSLRTVCEKIGVELTQVKDWICCGASSAHSVSSLLPTSLVAKNLSQIDKENQKVLVPCAACYSRFKTALHSLKNDPKQKEEVQNIIGTSDFTGIKILHPLEVFKNDLSHTIKDNIKNNLSSLRVACYYGCLLTRPPYVMQFDICEHPQSMDELLNDIGATCVSWSYSVDCCGASMSLVRKEAVLELTHRILEDAYGNGAEIISVACPLCQSNLDARQNEVNNIYHKNYNLPVVYFTQLLGLSLGIEPKKLGIDRHFVHPQKILKKF